MRMLEINIMTTDQTFVEGLNSAEIEGVRAEYRPTMAYDSAEHICEIVVTAIGSTALKLAAEWIIARWKKEKPKEACVNNQIFNNAEQITNIVNNFIEKQDRDA